MAVKSAEPDLQELKEGRCPGDEGRGWGSAEGLFLSQRRLSFLFLSVSADTLKQQGRLEPPGAQWALTSSLTQQGGVKRFWRKPPPTEPQRGSAQER